MIPGLYSAHLSQFAERHYADYLFLGNEIIAAGKYLDKITYIRSIVMVGLCFWVDPLLLMVSR